MFRATKGKTRFLNYKDATAGSITTSHSNANYGAFSFSGVVLASTAGVAKKPAGVVQVASAAKDKKANGKGCCAGK